MGDGGGENFFTEWEESYDSFDTMGLHENLLRGIYAYGEQPSISQIQDPNLAASSSTPLRPVAMPYNTIDPKLNRLL